MLRYLCQVSSALAVGALLLLGIVATTSAQGPTEGATDVRDFSEIQAGPLLVTPDESGRFATLTVETSTDVACSVVYGADDSFGLIAVDSDMDGGAHADHHPIMGGLEPDTAYRYRVQGTAPDGTIYVSDVMDFQTPPEPVDALTNHALSATVIAVSSEFSDAFGADFAFDADPTTEWSTRGDGDDAWVEVDLGVPTAIREVRFTTRSMSDGSATTTTFSVKADGADFGPFAVDAPALIDATARIWRFDVTNSTGGNTGAVEIQLLGE